MTPENQLIAAALIALLILLIALAISRSRHDYILSNDAVSGGNGKSHASYTSGGKR